MKIMENPQFLFDIKMDDDFVYQWDFKATEHRDMRVYYKPKSEGELKMGFDFIVLDWNTGLEGWDKDLECDIIIKGNAYYDEIRHMYFGDEGYVYCPGVEAFIDIFTILKDLQSEYCINI